MQKKLEIWYCVFEINFGLHYKKKGENTKTLKFLEIDTKLQKSVKTAYCVIGRTMLKNCTP